MNFKPKSITLSDALTAGGVGAVDIAAREVDNMQGTTSKPPFQSIDDITRTAVEVGTIAGSKFLSGKKKAMVETALIAETPLFVSTVWDAIRVYALKQPRL